jgi:hypothetical protein
MQIRACTNLSAVLCDEKFRPTPTQLKRPQSYQNSPNSPSTLRD